MKRRMDKLDAGLRGAGRWHRGEDGEWEVRKEKGRHGEEGRKKRNAGRRAYWE